MGTFLKYDFKRNKKFIRNTIIINLILIIAAFVINYLTSSRIFDNPYAVNWIFLSAVLYFGIVNLCFVITHLNRDYFTSGDTLTFSLPVSASGYTFSKLLLSGIFYLINMLFLLVGLFLIGYRITTDVIYYLSMGLVWALLAVLIISMMNQRARFRQGKSPVAFGLITLAIVFALAYFICKYFSLVLVNGSIQKALPMSYAFVFPFAVGKLDIYKNFTPMVFYILAVVVLFILAKNNLKKNLDLS